MLSYVTALRGHAFNSPLSNTFTHPTRQLSRFRRLPRLKSTSHTTGTPPTKAQKWTRRAAAVTVISGASVVLYHTYEPFRHTTLAVDRVSRVVWAVALDAIDYKKTMRAEHASSDEMLEAYSRCHKRSAERLLRALQANGGIYIKLGQHISSVNLLPLEWTSTMRPLQDQCIPTPYEDIEGLFIADTGKSIDELFSEFDPEPIGVASLAQVHIARDRETGKKLAVKLQHPRLEEFAAIDMVTAEWCLAVVERLFPEFEFRWFGEEMKQNLPLEMDFRHEAHNAARAESDFSHHRHTTLYIPKVYHATKRTMTMEFIDGARVDDLEYLSRYRIDRNRVAQELSRIFSEMVYINGFFHADPHPGNLLIRPAPPDSRSPYNFEIALLDHGLYFDIDDELRVNYARFWLSLMARPSPQTQAERRKYAQLVGNIQPDMYPIFESAITGHASLKSLEDQSDTTSLGFPRSRSLLDAPMDAMSVEEIEAIRNAVMQKEGLIPMLFELLRRMPRRVLMILKLNDLTRNLDTALRTTHPRSRIFIIVARYCCLAVWIDERKRFFSEWRLSGPTWTSIGDYVSRWWSFHLYYDSLRLVEIGMDIHARTFVAIAWLRGLWKRGLTGASRAAA
ncbi:hypothetical protein FRB99_003381, partial [Tulasnella sp. 403]